MGKQPSPLSPCSTGGRRAQATGRGAVGILWSQSHTPGPSPAPACVAVPACGCCMFGLGLGCCTAPLPVPSGKIKTCYAYALYCIFCEGERQGTKNQPGGRPTYPFILKVTLFLSFPTLATGGHQRTGFAPNSILGQGGPSC